MLVLTRKIGEQILIGDDIVITVLDSRGEGMRIGIEAPRGVKIQREEVVRAVTEANLAAAAADAAAADALKDLLRSGAVVSTEEPGKDPAERSTADEDRPSDGA